MMKKKQIKSQCFNCHANRHTLKECGFGFCLFCLHPDYRNSHHCNRALVKNFGFATIGTYQKYVRSLLVGGNYEAVRIRLQQERDTFNITNEYLPAQQPELPLSSSTQHAPVQSNEPQPEMTSPMPNAWYEPALLIIPEQQAPIKIPAAPQYSQNQAVRRSAALEQQPQVFGQLIFPRSIEQPHHEVAPVAVPNIPIPQAQLLFPAPQQEQSPFQLYRPQQDMAQQQASQIPTQMLQASSSDYEQPEEL
uniref:Uncharacterized protein n=1 Tax=Panagrolaimus sp. ES5 TaxID=591445 RepID=A0AC34G6U0_9BILA